MYGLIQTLYSSDNQRAFERLYIDSEPKEQMLLRSTLAEALKDCPKILPSHGYDWILCTLSSYNKSPDDTMRVYQGIVKHIDSFSIGILDDKIKWKPMSDIADSCLVGLAFFRKHIEEKHKRRALPSPDYYSKAGAVAFQRLGFDEIGDNFLGWVDFVKKEMTND